MANSTQSRTNYPLALSLLYVDDNPFSLAYTHEIFKKYFTHITTASDGQEGVEKFYTNRIDLIITDINMPKLNGLEMIKKIRQKDPDVPVLVLSSYTNEHFFIQSIGLDVDGYLLKPIETEAFENSIGKIIKKTRYKAEAASHLHFLKQYKEITNQSSIVSKTDTKGMITYVNDAFCQISGYAEEELVGNPHNIIRHPDNPSVLFKRMWETIQQKKETWKGIVRNQTKYGKSYYVDTLIMPILDQNGTIMEYISLRNDITDIMSPKKQLQDAINSADDPALIYIKLEDFEETKEFYSSDTIERLQRQIGSYLEERFSRHYRFDTMYRLGNGEYAFVIQKSRYMKNRNDLYNRLQKEQKRIRSEQVDLGQFKYDLKILLSLVHEKDKMVASAKRGIEKLEKNGENFIVSNHLISIEQKKAKKNMRTVSMIKKAIDNEKIISYFQPIVDNQTERTVKYESLVRLIDENDRVLPPSCFLEAAKKSNHYCQITNIVLEHSFSMLKNHTFDHSISINLSALDIEQSKTRQRVLQILEKYKPYASRVVFELLEDESIKDFRVVQQFIADVKAYGVKIAIDDFGAGYSNYERLLNYQPDILKIDGCLIRDIETSSYSLSAVKSIVTFAKEQELQTIAEFIENENIFNIVKRLGVDFSQGYYFGKPEPLQ